ncbi:MAG: hypothetical protein J6S00_06670 [Clostridia bacterium]|nr:hypothetical protein [Clostridia bacterium]
MIKNIIPRVIATLLILSVILSFTACGKEQNKPTNGGVDMPKVVYEFVLTYASHGIGDQNTFIEHSLNIDKHDENAIQHLPIFKFEGRSELDIFKRTLLAQYDLTATHNDVTSFNAATKNYDQSHFEENTVFVIAIPATSGSVRHKVENVTVSDNELLISVKAESPDAVTMDLVSWFMVVSVSKDTVSGYTSFDAVLG